MTVHITDSDGEFFAYLPIGKKQIARCWDFDLHLKYITILFDWYWRFYFLFYLCDVHYETTYPGDCIPANRISAIDKPFHGNDLSRRWCFPAMTYPGDDLSRHAGNDLSRRFRNYVFCFEWQCKYKVLLGGVLFFYGGLFLKKNINFSIGFGPNF